VQEVQDVTRNVPLRLLERINRDAPSPWALIQGPRLGRHPSGQEEYVIYYRPAVVAFVDSFTVPDPDGRFARPPLVARFQAGFFDFRLIGIHVTPDDAWDELAALAEVAEAVSDPTERDVILLGDFNADCSYLRDPGRSHPLRAAGYHWVIGDGVPTNVSGTCTYDRIILPTETVGHEFVAGSAQVFRFDEEFDVAAELVPRVSDHFPVYAHFRTAGPDDDGPVSSPPVAAGPFVGSSAGRTYYLAGCASTRRIKPENVVSFASEAEAREAGYVRSRGRGC